MSSCAVLYDRQTLTISLKSFVSVSKQCCAGNLFIIRGNTGIKVMGERKRKVAFMVSAEEEARLKQEAKICNQTLSAYLRTIVIERSQPKATSPRECRELYYDLNAIQQDLEAMIEGDNTITPQMILKNIKQIRADGIGVEVG